MSWSDCSDPATSGVTMTRIEVKDPVVLPGMLYVGFEGEARKVLERGSPFKVRMQKKVSFFWVDVPCQNSKYSIFGSNSTDNRIGSCDYKDFCNHWPLPGPDCAPSYKEHGIPCSCPFPIGKYSMPLSPVGEIKNVNIPKWLAKGEFKITAWITPKDSEDKLICINLDLHLDSP